MNDLLKALIFDVDGTLADTERDGHRVAFNRAFAEAGLDWHWSESLYGELLRIGGGKERLRYFIQHHLAPAGRPDNPDAFIAELHRHKNRHFAELVATGAISLRPGVMRLLREARDEGVRLAIATTASAENVQALLVGSGGPELPGWFEVVAAGDVVRAKKPAPDIYLYVLRRLGLGAEECLAIEDSDNGVAACFGAGIRSVVVTVNAYTRDQDFPAVSLVVDHLGEPERPAQALQGALGGVGHVDMALLRRLHAETRGAREMSK